MSEASDTVKKIFNIIKPQFHDSPEGELMAAVVHQALKDSTPAKTDRAPSRELLNRSAKAYLSGDMFQAEVAGVDSSWIRKIVKREEL